MKNKNCRNMFDNIKKWYEELSGASKFVIVLTVLLLMSNVIINIWSNRVYRDVEQAIDGIITDNTYELFPYFCFAGILDKLFEFVKYLFFLIISIFTYYISLYVGKVLGFFKSITEFFNDIKEDPFFIKVLVIYDIIGMFFDVYTIYSLVTT